MSTKLKSYVEEFEFEKDNHAILVMIDIVYIVI